MRPKFKKFECTSEWARIFRRYLEQYLIKRAKKIGKMTDSGPENIQSPESFGIGDSVPSEELPNEILQSFTDIVNMVEEQKLDPLLLQEQEEKGGDIARLIFWIKTWFSKKYSGSKFSSHETNFVFRYRNNSNLTSPERNLLFETLISDHNNICVGWYWLQDMGKEEILNELLQKSLEPRNIKSIRRQSIDCLGELEISFKEINDFRHNYFKSLLQDEDDDIKKKALSLLSTKDSVKSIDIMHNNILGKDSLSDEITNTEFEILSKTFPKYFVESFLKFDLEVKDQWIDNLRMSKNNLPTDLLKRITQLNESELCLFATKILIERDEMTVELADKLLDIDNFYIQRESLLFLSERGRNFRGDEIRKKYSEASEKPNFTFFNSAQEPNDTIFKVFRNYSEDQLMEEIDWFNIHGPEALKAMGLQYFDSVEGFIRRNLDTEFEYLKNESISDLRDSKIKEVRHNEDDLGEDEVEEIVDSYIEGYIEEFNDSISEYVLSNYISSSLHILSEYGCEDDIKYARKYLDELQFHDQLGAVKLIESFGDDQDFRELLSLAKNDFGMVSRKATEAIAKNQHKNENVLTKLLETDDSVVLKVLFDFFEDDLNIDDYTDDFYNSIYKRLFSENSDVRKLTVSFILKQNFELEELLDNYISESKYFYSVPCWLDRLLYAPQPFKDHYISELNQ